MTCVGLSLAASRTNINRPYSELQCPQSAPVPVPTQIGSLISIACDWFAENQSIGQSIAPPQAKQSKQESPLQGSSTTYHLLSASLFSREFFLSNHSVSVHLELLALPLTYVPRRQHRQTDRQIDPSAWATSHTAYNRRREDPDPGIPSPSQETLVAVDAPEILEPAFWRKPRITAQGPIVCKLSIGFSLFFSGTQGPDPFASSSPVDSFFISRKSRQQDSVRKLTLPSFCCLLP
jgi:hypothetical protein